MEFRRVLFRSKPSRPISTIRALLGHTEPPVPSAPGESLVSSECWPATRRSIASTPPWSRALDLKAAHSSAPRPRPLLAHWERLQLPEPHHRDRPEAPGARAGRADLAQAGHPAPRAGAPGW